MVIKALSADGILQLKGKSVCENKVNIKGRDRFQVPLFKHLDPAMPEVRYFAIVHDNSFLA